jgi:hypothetical protein
MSSFPAAYESLDVETHDTDIALVRLTKDPAKITFFTKELMSELKQCLMDLDNVPEIKGIVFTGNRKAFACMRNPHRRMSSSHSPHRVSDSSRRQFKVVG